MAPQNTTLSRTLSGAVGRGRGAQQVTVDGAERATEATDGTIATAQDPIGVLDYNEGDAAAGELVGLVFHGTVKARAGGAIPAGAEVTVNTAGGDGRFVAAAAGDMVWGRNTSSHDAAANEVFDLFVDIRKS